MCKKSYQRLDLEDRIAIEVGLSHDQSYSQIAATLKVARDKSTIQREVAPWGRTRYRAIRAQEYYLIRATKRKQGKVKIIRNPLLQAYIESKLELRWSPDQISNTLARDRIFKDQPAMQISHESIYRYVYLHAKRTLRLTLISQLRQEKKKRGNKPRNADGTTTDRRGKIPEAVSIEERPEAVLGREIPGHWEGDLIIGKDHKSAIGTLVERTSRAIIIVPLCGLDATTVRVAFEKAFLGVPDRMKKTMTYDNGKEMTQHKTFTQNTKIAVYFAHPYSPWERPTNENSNMLVRDYLPKGTDFNAVPLSELQRIEQELNTRPRKVHDYKTPKDVFDRLALTD